MIGTKKGFAVFLMVLCLSLLGATPSMGAGKGVRVKKTFQKYSTKTEDSLHVMFGAEQKVLSRATKTMKLSCTLYIPSGALKKGDFIAFDPMTYLFDKDGFYGTIFGKFNVQLELNAKNEPVLKKGTENGLSALSSKYGSVTKKKGYYVVKLKKLPLCSWAFEGTPDHKVKINTKKNVYLATYVRVYRHSSRKWTGSLFIDDLILYAKKTLKMTFDKKDYGDVFAYLFVEGKAKAVVSKLPF